MKEHYGLQNQIKAEPEHLSVASNFSHEMINRFSEDERSEIIKKIREIFDEELILEIEKADKRLQYLKSIKNS